MSTSYTERSSSERIIRSFDVAGMQIIPKLRQAVLVCDGKAGSDPETHPQGGEGWVLPLGKGRIWNLGWGYASWEGFLSVEGRGETSWQFVREVIALMNVCKKNYVYRHLFVNARIY